MATSRTKWCVYCARCSIVWINLTYAKMPRESQWKWPTHVNESLVDLLLWKGTVVHCSVLGRWRTSDIFQRLQFGRGGGSLAITSIRFSLRNCSTLASSGCCCLWSMHSKFQTAAAILFRRRCSDDFQCLFQDKSREEWIFDYPAQITLTASQIWSVMIWMRDVDLLFMF